MPNDGDGRIDWDGAGGEADPHCISPVDSRERRKRCGLGFERALILLPLLALSRLRRYESPG